ncbi:MAG: radical SAM protein [Deltaproteobacteria bacterium]|nr:radical SAM protein [Deltaproteobacteria bacterium]
MRTGSARSPLFRSERPHSAATSVRHLASLRGATVKRRTILVDLGWARDKDPSVPLGHASLLAALRTAGATDVVPLVFPVNAQCTKVRGIVEAVERASGGIAANWVDVCMGAYVWNERLLQDVLALLRQRGFGGRIVLGGPQVSYSGRGIDAVYPGADVFIRGFAEEALVSVTADAHGALPRGAHRSGEADDQSRAVPDFEGLPSPLLAGILPLVDDGRGVPLVRWETKRGCPYACAYCQHREPGARLRAARFSFERLKSEIAVMKAARVREIGVLDPVFNVGPDYLDVLAELRRQQFGGMLAFQCRPELVAPEFLDALRGLTVLLEFGLQTIHEKESRAINRSSRMDLVENGLSRVMAAGLLCKVGLIYGLPAQTYESFRASIAYCLERRVKVVRAFPLMLLRGTSLERDRERWGLVESEDPIPVVVASRSFDRAEWRRMDALAGALSRSEGHHPHSIDELEVIAAGQSPAP